MLRVFVYGTLKRGQRNHDNYCRDAAAILPATTVGRLFDLPFGFPGIRVPDSAIHATGSPDYLADAREQQATPPRFQTPEHPWSLVYGELISFPDANSLSRLDALEGYVPGERGLYLRVLIPVMVEAETSLAWAYALTQEAGSRLPDGSWPC